MDAAANRNPHESSSSAQLRLLETRLAPEWKLDDTTREVGRRGVAAARAALRSARRRDPDRGDDGNHEHSTAA